MAGSETSARRLLASNSFDAAGRSVAEFAMDVLFIGTLSATAFDMGLLNALGSIAFIAATLPVGHFVDRFGALRMLRLGMGSKTLLLLCLLLLAATQTLTIPMGLALATLLGFCNVLGETSQISAVALVPPRHRSQARFIARLTAADQAIGVIVPALCGTLFALLGAPGLLSVGMVAASLALICAAAIRPGVGSGPEEETDLTNELPTNNEPEHHGFWAGLKYLTRHRVVRSLTAASMLSNLGLALGSAVESLFIMRELGFGATGLGVYASLSALGGLLGAGLSTKIAEKFPPSKLAIPTLIGQIVFSSLVLAAAFTPREGAIVLLALHAVGWGVIVIIFNVAVSTLIVESTPPHLLGRVTSARRLFTFGVVPLGGLGGGALGAVLGVPYALGAWTMAHLAALALYLLLRGGRSPQRSKHENTTATR